MYGACDSRAFIVTSTCTLLYAYEAATTSRLGQQMGAGIVQPEWECEKLRGPSRVESRAALPAGSPPCDWFSTAGLALVSSRADNEPSVVSVRQTPRRNQEELR
jgi:hypothetical protein